MTKLYLRIEVDLGPNANQGEVYDRLNEITDEDTFVGELKGLLRSGPWTVCEWDVYDD